ncbi:hypothetical protein [Deinococcus misasensis]|uniref:hypothetical protein n=1 Tax=Deinococcus misasensis TaxID=392413 RepID=UPI001FE14672|nr:hypothetical protein [Deinococcus misasensis]
MLLRKSCGQSPLKVRFEALIRSGLDHFAPIQYPLHTAQFQPCCVIKSIKIAPSLWTVQCATHHQLSRRHLWSRGQSQPDFGLWHIQKPAIPVAFDFPLLAVIGDQWMDHLLQLHRVTPSPTQRTCCQQPEGP